MIRIPTGRALILLALAAVLAAPAVVADVYHVRLVNGQVLDSRYPPEEASWDPGTIMLQSETGNWVGVRRSDVVRIESETEIRGYGRRLDATTIYMGRTANAAPVPGAEGEQDPTRDLLQAIYSQQQQQQDYTIEQFVEPGETGGGIPVGFTQQVTPPIGVAPPNSQ